MEDKEKVRSIYQELLEKYGEPEEPDNMSGIDYLIETILSQNTNDINRDKAFRNLKDKYEDDYRAIENADREELIEAIRIAGLGPTKAERIQEALKIVREDQGGYSIDFLEEMDISGAKKWLTDIPGIGPKTASVILCFHFKMPTFPVDTHVHRLSKRLGLVPENASRTKTHNVMEEKVPDEIKYAFHILMITHGRNGCTAHDESCEICEKYREK
ncbi:MAG: DNA lyase [Nanohaloarchaea archaeon SW_7_43_1]|nr:MAG: DNA lyase [Nanohaloarchaea archaeon SW_7_43_1]